MPLGLQPSVGLPQPTIATHRATKDCSAIISTLVYKAALSRPALLLNRVGWGFRQTVSISSSIFQKPCPACAITAPVSAERCQCGHIFESAAQHFTPQESALRDEELYEGYLSARAEQSHQAAYVAEQALAENPRDPEIISAAELAREVARSIEADLDAQRTKIAALRRALPVVKPVILPAPPKAASLLALPEATDVVEIRPVPSRPVASSTVYSPPALNPLLQRASAVQKAAGVLAALKNAKAKEVITRARKAAVAEPQISAPVVSPPIIADSVASSSTPSIAFRQDQAARAEKVMEARQAVDAKECPNCTASVPLNTSRCHCGFGFISGNTELPSLTLCTGDFTALRNSFKLNLR